MDTHRIAQASNRHFVLLRPIACIRFNELTYVLPGRLRHHTLHARVSRMEQLRYYTGLRIQLTEETGVMDQPASVITTPTTAKPSRAAACEPTAVMRRRRILAGLVALGGLAVLSLAAWLKPASEGVGTHETLGLPPCGWIMLMDTPCPTCGMTTAFSHAADGHLLAAMATQPLGALLALGTAMTVLIAGYIAGTGSRIGHLFAGLLNKRTMWLLLGVLLAAWLFKVGSYRGWL